MIWTDGKPTIASSGATPPRRDLDIRTDAQRAQLRRLTDHIGRGTACPACVAEGRPPMVAGGCYRHDAA